MSLWLSLEAPALLCIEKVLFSQLSNWIGARSHTRLFSCRCGSGRVQQRHLIGLCLWLAFGKSDIRLELNTTQAMGAKIGLAELSQGRVALWTKRVYYFVSETWDMALAWVAMKADQDEQQIGDQRLVFSSIIIRMSLPAFWTLLGTGEKGFVCRESNTLCLSLDTKLLLMHKWLEPLSSSKKKYWSSAKIVLLRNWHENWHGLL